MLVSIKFNSRDEIHYDKELRVAVVYACLTHDERQSAVFRDGVLYYATNDSAGAVIERWECDGYNIDEFEYFTFKRE